MSLLRQGQVADACCTNLERLIQLRVVIFLQGLLNCRRGVISGWWWLFSWMDSNPSRTTDSHLKRIINTKCCIHTIVPPDDGPRYARNMYRLTKHTKNKLCIKLVFLYTTISRCTVNKTYNLLFVCLHWCVTYISHTRGELSYLAPLGSENISAPYFKHCFFRGGVFTPQTESNTTPPSPKTEITNISFYILNFASIIKFKM